MYQRLIVKESNQRIAELAVGFPNDSGAARGVVILPLGVLLPSGVNMQIDDRKPFRFDLRYCLPDGCYGFISMKEPLLNILRKGNDLKLMFQTLDGKDMSIGMSLNGFTKALEETRASYQ